MQMQLEVLLRKLASKFKTVFKKHGPKKTQQRVRQLANINIRAESKTTKQGAEQGQNQNSNTHSSRLGSDRCTLGITLQSGCGNSVLIYCVVVIEFMWVIRMPVNVNMTKFMDIARCSPRGSCLYAAVSSGKWSFLLILALTWLSSNEVLTLGAVFLLGLPLEWGPGRFRCWAQNSWKRMESRISCAEIHHCVSGP